MCVRGRGILRRRFLRGSGSLFPLFPVVGFGQPAHRAIVIATSGGAGALAAGSAAAAAAAADTEHKETPSFSDIAPMIEATEEAPHLKAALEEEISSFKEILVREQFFGQKDPTTTEQTLSWEENGRSLGALLAHDSLNNIQEQIALSPRLAQEIQDIEAKYAFFLPNNGLPGHSEIDAQFSTSYGSFSKSADADFRALSYQARGERALSFGYYNQAVEDFDKVIETNPAHPIPYLERGVAHFGLGHYEKSLEDYYQFAAQVEQPNSPSALEFIRGFAKGLPKGMYESGEGLLLFLGDFATHPVHTAGQMVKSVTKLATLIKNDEWGVVAEALSPQMHELLTQWDILSSEQRGELAGYAFGKHGTDS